MKSLPKIVLILGILMTAGGVAGTAYFYRDMKIENLVHARTGDIPLALGTGSDWKNAAFSVFRTGSHSLIVSLENRARSSSPENICFRGSLEIEVFSPDGAARYQKTITPKDLEIPRPDSIGMITLGRFDVDRLTEESWSIRARIAAPDAAFSGISAELSVLPPQLYEIGSYLSNKLYTLIAMGIMGLVGFIVVVFSAYLQQRANAAGN